MTKEEKTEALRAATVEKYKAYKAGRITKDEWGDYLIKILDNYVKALIAKHHFTAKAEYEDLYNEGLLSIWLYADAYDPITYNTMPTSFFKDRILEGMRSIVEQEIGNSEMTGHYKAKVYELNKCAQESGYEGINDEKLTAAMLSALSNMSLVTVERAMELASYMSVSLDVVTDNFDSGRHYGEPERQMINEERSEKLASVWNNLNPLEQYLLRHTELAEDKEDIEDGYGIKYKDPRFKKIAVRNLVSTLRTPEARAEFGNLLPKNPTKIDSDFISNTIINAIKRFKDSYAMQPYIQVKEPMSFCDDEMDAYEQASLEDIRAAMEEIAADSDEFTIREAEKRAIAS